MALYRVNRRILIDWRAYNPGSEIELSDVRAKQFRNGQITLIPPKKEPVKEAEPVHPVSEDVGNEPKVATPEATGTDKTTAPDE